jgi:hypothetical protein
LSEEERDDRCPIEEKEWRETRRRVFAEELPILRACAGFAWSYCNIAGLTVVDLLSALECEYKNRDAVSSASLFARLFRDYLISVKEESLLTKYAQE